jgi:hypothetical protein
MNAADYQRLESALAEHGERAFRKLRKSHPKERFYAFAFVTDGMFRYLYPTAATYERLRQMAKNRQASAKNSNRSLEAWMLVLKWSDQSPLYLIRTQLDFPGSNLLAPFSEMLRGLAGRNWPDFDGVVRETEGAIANALTRIDQTGVFGTGLDRDDGVVNLLMEDQSDQERIEFARRVNRPESVQMLVDDLRALDRDES